MVCTISLVTTPGADTPMNTSAPASTSAREPVRFSGFVTWAISSLIQFMLAVAGLLQMAPFRSQRVTSPAPAESSSFVMETAAAPAPLMTIRTSSSRLPTTFRSLVSPARVMTAVPC